MTNQTIKLPHLFRTVCAEPIPSTRQPDDARTDVVATQPRKTLGPDQAAEDLTNALSRLAAELSQLNCHRDRVHHEMQSVAAEIAIATAEWILHRQISNGRHAVDKIVAGVLAECSNKSPLAVYLHPQDAALLDADRIDVEIKTDPSISRGDCRADLRDYWIVCNWRDNLQKIRSKVIDSLHDAQSERK
jgi:hypothetical protein